MSEDTNQMPPRIEAWTEPLDQSMTFTCVAGTDEHWASTCDWVPSLPGSAEYVRADIAERLANTATSEAHASRDAEVAELRAENERMKARSDAFSWVEIMFDNVPVSELGVEVIKLVERFHAANPSTANTPKEGKQ